MSEDAAQQAEPELLEERRGDSGQIVWLTLNRPQARNALTFAMYERIGEVCLEVNADPSVRTVVFTGAGGRAFAAGTDISQFRAFDKKEDALAYEERMDRVLGALESVRVPTIAA
ncbi:MAG: enoyl-CoA hydratase, partial [Chloroflexi bacterium]